MLWMLLVACQPPPVEPPSWCATEGQAFGTTWSAKWRAETCDPAVNSRAQAVLADVDAKMSSWRDDSEISRVRKAAGPEPVSADTWAVVHEALRLAEATDGAFDPTVQPLMEVWGFHDRTREMARPSDEELATARAQVGWAKVTAGFDADGPWIHGGGTALDLSAIAKGYAVDRVSHSLSQQGLRNHMVEIGGEVRATGEGPNGAWSFGVDVPTEGAIPGAEFVAVVQLTNAALATSGNYRNLVVVDGEKVHHTMNPRTGAPAVTDIASASVVAPDCAEADALATAVMVLGAERGMALIESRSDVEALVLVSRAEGLEQRTSSGMQAHLRTR